MHQLLNITDEQDPLAVRDRAIMELMYSSGLRLAELVGINLVDLKLDDRQLKVTGKGLAGAGAAHRPNGGGVAGEVAQGAATAGRRRERGAVCFQPQAAAVGPLGAGPSRWLGQQAGAQRSRPSPQAAPQLCHPYAGVLRRFAGGAGSCWAMPTCQLPRSIPTSTSSTWPRSTTAPTPGAKRDPDAQEDE